MGVGRFMTLMVDPSRTLNSTGELSVFLNSLILSLRSLVYIRRMAVGKDRRPSGRRTP